MCADFRERLKGPVTEIVTICVVEMFKFVGIDHDHADWVTFRCADRRRRRCVFKEVAAIIDAREVIGDRHTAKRVFGLFALANIARDDRKPFRPRPWVVRLAKRRDHRTSPEPLAVTTNPPAFVFMPSVSGCAFQKFLDLHQVASLWRTIETVLAADGFFGAVAFDALGGTVPRFDPPGLVERVDRIITNAVENRLKALLSAAKDALLFD